MDFIQFIFPTFCRNYIGYHGPNMAYPRIAHFFLPVLPIYFNDCFSVRRRSNIANTDSPNVNNTRNDDRPEESGDKSEEGKSGENIHQNIYNTFESGDKGDVGKSGENIHQKISNRFEAVTDTSEEICHDFIVGNPNTVQFKLVETLAHGTFSEVHLGINLSNGKKVAVKLEPRDTCDKMLLKEYRAYKMLTGGTGISKIWWYGTNGEFNVLVMDLLGPDLFTLFTTQHEMFSIPFILLLAQQMIDIIEYVHSRNFVHRDIKPENFAFGLGYKQSKLFLIDFGFAEEFIEQDTSDHVMFTENNGFTGTLLYSSINALMGRRQSRRDDLESIGYLVVFFIKNSLPWQIADAEDVDPVIKTLHLRMCTTLDSLCYGLPYEFIRYFLYCRNMKFQEAPDYNFLRCLFTTLLDTFEAANNDD